MSNPLKYTTSTPTGALRHATLGAGVANGEYDSTWRSGITPYTLTSYYLVYEPDSGGEVRVYAPADAAELIQLAQSKGSSETTEAGALTWLSSNGFYPANKVLDNIVTDGLALLLDSTTATSYPRSGKDWLDLSGEANDGILNNGVSFEDEYESLSFDGVDQYATIASDAAFTVNTRTVEITFKMNGAYANFSPLATYANGSSTSNRIWLGLQNNKWQMHGWGTTDPTATTTIIADGWYTCVFSYNGNAVQQMKLYTNGQLESTTTNTQGGVIGVAGNNWYLATIPGGWQSQTYSAMDINSFKVYSKILTNAEVLQNYYQGPIVTDGLVFAVDAGNLVSFENGTTTAHSLTGSIDGTLTNGVAFNSSSGGYWEFDGVDDQITLSTNINLGNGNIAWTVSAWVKSTTTANSLGKGSVASNDNGGPVYSMMGINSGKMVYWTYQSSAWAQKLGVATVNDGDWHLLTWVNYSDTTMDMYVDGVFDKNVTNSTSGNNNPIDTIGNSWAAGFEGEIATLHIYSKSLTAEEITQNYNANVNLYN